MMASKFHFILIFLFLYSLIITSKSKVSRAPFRPDSLVLPIYKDEPTSLYVANIHKRTPSLSLPFLVDLNGEFLWVDCEQKNYSSSTYKAPFCHSSQCSRAGVHYCHKCSSTVRPGCHNNTCAVIATNPLTNLNEIGELASDVLSIHSLGGELVKIPNFLFTCARSSLLKGPIPRNVKGVVGLGHTSLALPLQLSSKLGFPPQFGICLPSLANKNGAIFFGTVTGRFQPDDIDVTSAPAVYTPLTIGADGEYIILVKSIKINDKKVFKRSLLSTTRGFSGTMISTVKPYTVLEHSVFQNFTEIFTRQLSGRVRQVQAVSPFRACFDSNQLRKIKGGLPNIDFVMQNRNVTWTISEANSLVQARPRVSCLAFVDGGINTTAPIVIGAYQLRDNFLQFDLEKSRLSFGSSLLPQGTSCADLNFTSSFINHK